MHSVHWEEGRKDRLKVTVTGSTHGGTWDPDS